MEDTTAARSALLIWQAGHMHGSTLEQHAPAHHPAHRAQCWFQWFWGRGHFLGGQVIFHVQSGSQRPLLLSAGGIGEAVCAAISGEPDIMVRQLAAPVMGMSRSGRPGEMLSMFGVSARHIVLAVKRMLMQ